MRPIKRLLTLLLVVVMLPWSAVQPSVAQDSDVELPRMGMNITTPSYADGMLYFNDATRHGSDWISHNPENPAVWSDEREIPLTEDGYPAMLADEQAARMIVFLESIVAPEGDYTLVWSGSGELSIGGFDEAAIFTDEDAPRQTVSVAADEGLVHLFITIIRTDPTDPIRDIRLYLPGTDENSPRFTPWLLDALAPFQMIRFMDWNWTNYTFVSAWDERSLDAWASWSAESAGFIGVPYEVQIELSNTTGMHMWVAVPHLADDEHVRQLATLIRDTLDPDLQVWVEYSNEAWNPIFPVFDYLLEEAQIVAEQEGLEDHYIYHQYARRSGEVMTIFDEVFGDEADRVIGVFAGQAGYAAPAELGYQEIQKQGTLQFFDVFALAPYFGDAWENEDGGNVNVVAVEFYEDGEYTEDEYNAIFDIVSSNIDAMFMGGDEYGDEMLANRDVAETMGLPIVTYEAGQSLTAGYFGNGVPEYTYYTVNQHPRMYDLYIQYLDGWAAYGGQTMVMFHLGGFWNGSETFGHLEYPQQPLDEAHKYRALLDWLAMNPN